MTEQRIKSFPVSWEELHRTSKALASAFEVRCNSSHETGNDLIRCSVILPTFDQRQSPKGLLWAPSYRFAAKAAKPKHMLDAVFFSYPMHIM